MNAGEPCAFSRAYRASTGPWPRCREAGCPVRTRVACQAAAGRFRRKDGLAPGGAAIVLRADSGDAPEQAPQRDSRGEADLPGDDLHSEVSVFEQPLRAQDVLPAEPLKRRGADGCAKPAVEGSAAKG